MTPQPGLPPMNDTTTTSEPTKAPMAKSRGGLKRATIPRMLLEVREHIP